MDKNYFPQEGKTYIQTNRTDRFGSLWSSMGLDFQSNLGTLRVAPRLKVNTATADAANLGLPVAFEAADTGPQLWAICGGRIFKNVSATGTPNSAFTEDASTGAVTTYNTNSDLENFDNRLWSSADTALYSKVLNGSGTGAWTSRDTLTTGAPHPLKYFQKFNRLYYVTSANIVASISAANVVAAASPYYLDLGAGNDISCFETTSNDVWVGISTFSRIGTSSSASGLVAAVFRWDGISAQATSKYLLKSASCAAMTVMDDIPYLMDGNGVLNKFTGSSFEEIGRLPFTTILPKYNYIAMNGMTSTKNGTILVVVNNLNGDFAGSVYENIPSGVWEWSKDFGFTHKYPFTYTPSASSTITDYGQNRISAPGAIYNVAAVGQSVSGRNGTILAGATYFTDATTTTNAIFFNDSNNTLQKKGYFVTNWFQSAEIQDKWTRLYETYRRLLGSTDSIVMKYRLSEEAPVYADITWVNTTSFTTATDISAYGPTASGFSGTSGGEVEILQGTGSASCAHITGITGAGPYTVTLDTAIQGVTTGTAKARFQKWLKLTPEVTGQVLSSSEQSIGGYSDVRCQIKGCLTFTGDGEFYKLALVSNTDQSINL